MLGKKTLPVVGKLAGTWSSINRNGFSDTCASQTSPPEYKIPSPRGLKNYDLGGIGLGIVAALEKSDQIQANKAVFVQNLTRSNPIPVKKPADSRCRGASESEEIEMDSLEDYTFVTFNGPNKTYTRVYCDRGDDYCGGKSGYHRRRSIFDVSAAGFGEDHFAEYPVADFLSSCNLCKKKLHGKDIYMYRGDKAFCSTECRYREMMSDERKEKCRSEAASRPSTTDVSNSPYANGQIFSPGILAI